MNSKICIFSALLCFGLVSSQENICSETSGNNMVSQKRFKIKCSLVSEFEEKDVVSDGECSEKGFIEKEFRIECKLVEVETNGTKHCAEGWIQYQESCYLLWDKSTLNFSDAAEMCRRYGAHLVFVETEAENDFLKQKLRTLTATKWWMGLTDLDTEGTWKYYGTDKVATFTNWRQRQPDNAQGKENCAHFWEEANAYEWNDYFCSLLFHVICEKKLR